MTRVDSRFLVQQVSAEQWQETTLANAVIDHLHGYKDVVGEFLAGRQEPAFQNLGRKLAEGRAGGADEIERRRRTSLQFLVLMLTGACNADCPICFTDRRKKADELTSDERRHVLRQARDLGARFVYVPGEGEPTIDSGFWAFLEDCRDLDLPAVVFTNGLVLSDAAACRRYWGMEPDQAVDRLTRYPVSFYVKLWTAEPLLFAEMMKVPARRFDFTYVDGMPVPAGLARLLESFPRERLGIEVVVERRNAEEVVERIVPFAQRQGLAQIVEMIQHNGRILDDAGYDPTAEQRRRTAGVLSPTSCTMATCKAVVTSCGFVSPRIAILEHQLPADAANVRERDLFTILHTADYVVERRYQVNRCLCEEFPAGLSRMPRRLLQLAPNVPPPAIAGKVIA